MELQDFEKIRLMKEFKNNFTHDEVSALLVGVLLAINNHDINKVEDYINHSKEFVKQARY